MNYRNYNSNKRPIEVWFQTNFDHDLWEADNGLIVNTSALNEREAYFDVSRVPSAVSLSNKQGFHTAA